MLVRAGYNTIKAICGMSTRSAHTEMKSLWLKASSHTPAQNVARWKPHRGTRKLQIANCKLSYVSLICNMKFAIPS